MLRRIFERENVDIFCYGEAQVVNLNSKLIEGFECYLHRAHLNKNAYHRRGLAIFFREKYRFLFCKVYACDKFDIVWMRLVLGSKKVYLCFFYAPGDHHKISVRRLFYDYFVRAFDRFATLGKVYLIGDTNARLGSYLNDVNINGTFTSNRNRSFLLSFLEYSGLSVLNKKYQLGTPTYEVLGKKRSIIDMCFTNSDSSILDFKVLPHFLGVSSQTCHKILRVIIRLYKPVVLNENDNSPHRFF